MKTTQILLIIGVATAAGIITAKLVLKNRNKNDSKPVKENGNKLNLEGGFLSGVINAATICNPRTWRDENGGFHQVTAHGGRCYHIWSPRGSSPSQPIITTL